MNELIHHSSFIIYPLHRSAQIMTTKSHQINSPLILTLDIGTSSSRAMLFDRRAKSVSGMLAQIPYQMQTTADGDAQFDPAVLFESVVNVIDQLLHRAGPLAEQIQHRIMHVAPRVIS